jgi:hypothetical protein
MKNSTFFFIGRYQKIKSFDRKSWPAAGYPAVGCHFFATDLDTVGCTCLNLKKN